MKNLLKKVERYKKLQAEKLEIEVEMNELKELFTAELEKQKVDELLVEAYKISLLQYTKQSFQSKEFKKENEEMYNRYCIEKEIKSVVVK